MNCRPHIQFNVVAWLSDPQLSQCCAATRGVWIDLICRLHELQKGGQITANVQQIARLCRSTEAEINAALAELQTTGTADVSEIDGLYTIICRRMKKEADLSAKRQQAGSKRGSKIEATPYFCCGFADHFAAPPPSIPSSPPHTPPLTPQLPNSVQEQQALQRVREFAQTEGIPIADAEWFFYKGEGNGWTNNGKPILDWKATLRCWKRAGYLPSQKRPQQSSNGPSPPREFSKPKERAPNYPGLPPKREPTEEEIRRAKAIAAAEVERLRQKFQMPQ